MTLISPEIGILILLLALVAVIAVFAFRNIMPLMPFFYANAVIQARTSRLIKESGWKDLAENKSLTELANNLKNTNYEEDELGKAKNINEFHTAIEKSFIKSLVDLEKTSPNKMKPLFDAYNRFWEAKIIKTFYRSRFSQTEEELEKLNLEESGLVFPVGAVSSNLLKHLTETKTLNDIKTVMSQTNYASVFANEFSNIEKFEVALDNFVLETFVKVTKEIKMHDAKYIADILNTKFDIFNLLALLKAEARGIPKEDRLNILIKNDSELSKRITKLNEAKTLEEFVEKCEGLPFYEHLTIGLESYKKDKSLAEFEKELYTYYKGFVIDIELGHTLGPYPIFAFLTKKEIEMKNLFAISKGIDSGFSPKEIEELIL